MRPVHFSHKAIVTALVLVCLFSGSISSSCTGVKNSISDQNTATITRGDIESTVQIRGKLEMPHEIKLHFGTYGAIEDIYVTYGSVVKAGTLLAKLDDDMQRQAVEQAQYGVQMAMNELVEKTYSTIVGYPQYYPSIGIVQRFEAAQDELAEAIDLMDEASYREAATEMRLAIHDLQACRQLLDPPVEINSEDYPNIFKAMNRVEDHIDSLAYDTETTLSVQGLINNGLYDDARKKLATVEDQLAGTRLVINSIVGVIKSYSPSYPDTSTSLDIAKQVQDSLEKIQSLLEQNDGDAVDTAEQLRIAIHDLEMSNAILENSELIFHHGLNLKLLRYNNLNLSKAEKALESAKEALMNTEIIAPFDGIIVDVPAKEGDIISTVDMTARTIVELVDTSIIELDGYVDERDVRNISLNQSVDIFVDVIPDKTLTGKVIFVSPYGNTQTGSAKFLIKVALDPADIPLQRGLSATAVIPLGNHSNALLVPANAVKSSAGEYWVNVVIDQKSGQVEKRSIIPGLQNDDFVEVMSGLEENEVVTLFRLSQ